MPLIIPIFLPHEGCPHCCVFCNQHSISGYAQDGPLPVAEVATSIQSWLTYARSEQRRQVQVAFYGGSFTALPLPRQEELLLAVQPFIKQGLVREIRISTRPDGIDAERLALLHSYGVTTIELGAQSCDDEVLRRSGRGHDSQAVIAAAALIKKQQKILGIQLMPGLPGDSFAALRHTTASVLRIRPDFVRLYPALVLRGSVLASLYQQGKYQPLSLAKATLFCAWMKKRFDGNGIRVVRMGLQASASLEQALIAGPYHPAFGHLVASRLMLHRIRQVLPQVQKKRIGLVVAKADLALFYGHDRCNFRQLERLGWADRFSLRIDPDQARFTLRTEPFDPKNKKLFKTK